MNIKRFYNQVRGFFPSPLPTGVSEFNSWVDSIAYTYQLPTSDQDSLRFSLASQVMHLGPTVASKPKYYFALALRAGAAKQIAGNAFYEVKQNQAARQAALAAEATASVGSDATKGL